MLARFSVAFAAGAMLAAPALAQVIHNPGFEIPDGLGGAEGWRDFNENTRRREAGDGILPAVTPRTGTACLEIFGDGLTNFGGVHTNHIDPVTLDRYSPTIFWPSGDVTFSGWYMVPADSPLPSTVRSSLKMEFKNMDNNTVFPFEDLSIQGHTNGQWVQFSITAPAATLNSSVPLTEVALLPIVFGPPATGWSIFWDDLELVQEPAPCVLEGDLNEDGVVDVFDLLFYLDIWFDESANGCP